MRRKFAYRSSAEADFTGSRYHKRIKDVLHTRERRIEELYGIRRKESVRLMSLLATDRKDDRRGGGERRYLRSP